MSLITEKRLQANRELLIGQKIKRFFVISGTDFFLLDGLSLFIYLSPLWTWIFPVDLL